MLLLGAVAKSAQIPLHTWLPDAMEGPTPVSALIHAATMVTAGVYLVARTHVLFENAPDVQALVAVLGVLTLLMAGVIALVQTDIKRIIAYSTMSQIGYMFAAVGIGAYSAGMFHLLTHAFFKALLFLGAGIVIHALANEQDVRRMGGLAKAMPRTTMLMWVGTIALIGFWPLSKDQILAAALDKGSTAAWIVFVGGLIGAGLHRHLRHPADAAGVLRRDERLRARAPARGPRRGAMDDVLAGAGAGDRARCCRASCRSASASPTSSATSSPRPRPPSSPAPAQDLITTVLAWGLGGAGALYVWRLYDDPARVADTRRRFETFAIMAEAKFGWDELYDNIAYRPAVWLAVTLDRVVERGLVGGSIWVTRTAVAALARATALAQSGIVRQYATVLAMGAAVVAVYFLGKASL